MHFHHSFLKRLSAPSTICLLIVQSALAQATKPPAVTFAPALIASGQSLFVQQCAFCHGRDAAGGEAGPDLTRSKLTAEDTNGEKLSPVIRNGRTDHGMPAFNLPETEMSGLVAFIHDQKTKGEAQKGGRRGVDPADLQTGNVEAGKAYFNGATGKCASCHSPTGDLAGVATRFQGLQLEQRLLYPRGAKAKVTVTLPSGEAITGELVSQDEFTVAMRDSSKRYRSWSTDRVKFAVDAPAEAHSALLAKYSDSDIHNLMAYLQTMK